MTACGTDSGSGPSDGFDRADLPALFAPPTAAERQLVLDDWSRQDLSPTGVRDEAVDTILVNLDSLQVRVVSHLVHGERHYGAVVTPIGARDPVPALVYAHFSDVGVSVESTLFVLGAITGLRGTHFALVIPAFRGLQLSYRSRQYVSGGRVSPWDGEVDDALALLNVAWQQPGVAPGRAATIGFSGGATIGLLMAIREPGIEGVVDYFATVDFFGPFVEDLFVHLLDDEPPDLPKIPDLETLVVQPLLDGRLSLTDMRLQLLRRSAAHFADRLPRVLAHHGLADDVVPDAETVRLVEAIRAAGGQVEAYYYPGGGHSPFALSGSLGRTLAFLQQLAPAAKTAGGSVRAWGGVEDRSDDGRRSLDGAGSGLLQGTRRR